MPRQSYAEPFGVHPENVRIGALPRANEESGNLVLDLVQAEQGKMLLAQTRKEKPSRPRSQLRRNHFRWKWNAAFSLTTAQRAPAAASC